MVARQVYGSVKASSQSAIIDAIRAAGTISRVELAELTGLTAATISTTVKRLLSDGLVAEVGRGDSTGGKPRVLLSLNPGARFAIGIQLEAAGTTYVIADLGGAIVARWRRASSGAGALEVVADAVVRDLTAMMEETGMSRAGLLGIGIAASGSTTSLTEPVARGMGCSVLADSNANASAIGEYWSGAPDTGPVFATLYLGLEIGAGVIVDGSIYRGASSHAGAIGHMSLDVDGLQCWCGGRGCLEAIAGPAAVVHEAREYLRKHPIDGLDISDDDARIASDFAALARAASRGQPYAIGLLQHSARYFGAAVVNLANMFDLDTVVLSGSGFSIAAFLYLPVIQDALDRSFFARYAHGVNVRLSSNTADAAAVGAAALVLQSEIAPLSHRG